MSRSRWLVHTASCAAADCSKLLLRDFRAENQIARVLKQLLKNPPHAAMASAITPPTKPVITSARINCYGPIHAPIAAHSFTSPAPIPPIKKRNP